jgi:hypothetical protein
MSRRIDHAVETIPKGAARSLGLTFYRTERFNEIELQLWWVVVYVSRPLPA